MTRLEQERRRRGWNQTALAFYAGITQGEVSKIENRRLIPTDTYKERLSKVLGIPADELLEDVSVDEMDMAAAG